MQGTNCSAGGLQRRHPDKYFPAVLTRSATRHGFQPIWFRLLAAQKSVRDLRLGARVGGRPRLAGGESWPDGDATRLLNGDGNGGTPLKVTAGCVRLRSRRAALQLA